MRYVLTLLFFTSTVCLAQRVDTVVARTSVGDIKTFLVNGAGGVGVDSLIVSHDNKRATLSPLDLVLSTAAINALAGKATGSGSASGTNTGDNATNTQYSGLAAQKLNTNGDGSALTGLTKAQVGLSAVENTSDANKPVSSATQTALNLKANLASPAFTGTVTGITAAMVGAEPTITVLSFAKGGISASAATSATTGVMTVNMTSSIITITPTGACTFNASGGVAGQIVTFSITTSGVSSFVLTWGTNFRKTGTLATGTTSARFFTVTFRCLDGTIWSEIGRTAAQT